MPSYPHNKMMDLKVGQALTESEAEHLFGAQQYAQGGGWASFLSDDGREVGVTIRKHVYGCTGCHREGVVGWMVKEITLGF